MDFIRFCIEYLTHLQDHLTNIVDHYKSLTYLILAIVLFCETGLVITPILPGDSLLFATGAIASQSTELNIWILLPILFLAVIAGDNVNYFIGRKIGIKLFHMRPFNRILKMKYLERTEKFYDKYGRQTIIFARYVPIVRTFAPFVAGIGRMRYGIYITYCIIGGATWVAAATLAGYFFGSQPFVKHNFEFVVFAIIIISFIPPVFEYFRFKRKDKKAAGKK